jgi:hypothetical protein
MVIVFPSTKRTSENSRKKIVLISALSIVHPNMVAPPRLDCIYITAEPSEVD